MAFLGGTQKPAPWSIVPGLTKAPNLWDGLGTGLVIPFFGNAFDHSPNRTPITVIGSPDFTVSSYGGIGTTFGSGNRLNFPQSVRDALVNSFTVGVVITKKNADGSDGFLIDGTQSANNGIELDAQFSTGSFRFVFALNTSAGTGNFFIDMPVQGSGPASYAIICRWDGTTATLQSHGVSSTLSRGGTITGNYDFYFGSKYNGTDPLSTDIAMNMAVVSSRCWGEGEVQQFLRNPYDMITPALAFPWFAEAGGAPPVALAIPAADISLGTSVPALAIDRVLASPAVDLAIAAVAPGLAVDAAIAAPAVDISIAAAAPSLITGNSLAIPATDIGLAAVAPTLLLDVVVPAPAVDLAVAAVAPAIVADLSFAIPATDIALAGVAPSVSVSQILSVDNLTILSGSTRYTIEA